MAETEEIKSPFVSDGEGFLVGKRVDAQSLKDEFGLIGEKLTGIEKSVAAIEKAMTGAGLRLANDGAKAVSAAARPERARRTTAAEKESAKQTAKAVETGAKKGIEAAIAESRHNGETVATNDGAKAVSAAAKNAAVAATDENAALTIAEKTEKAVSAAVAENRKPQNKLKPETKAIKTQPAEVAVPKKAKRTNGAKAEVGPDTGNGRDAKGRFVAKQKKDGGLEGYEAAQSASELAGKLAEAVREGSEDAKQTDPVVQAVSEVAEPVSHAFGALTGLWEKDGEEGILKRILTGLTRFRREQSAFNKSEKKALAGIESNTDDIDKIGGKREGGFGDLLSRFGGKEGAGGLLSTIGAGVAKFAKKIPLIGSLFAAGKGIFDIANSELDTTTTREQKDVNTGRAIGDAGGVIAGGFAGAKLGALAGSFLGPIGTAVGTAVGGAAGMFFGSKAGKVLGETVGGWVADLRRMDIGGTIKAAWANCVDGISNAWTAVTGTVSDAWNGAIEGVSAAWTSVTETVSSAWTGFVDGLSNSWNSLLEGVSGFWDKAKEGAAAQLKGVNDWLKEKTGIDVAGGVSSAFQAVSGAVKGTVGILKEVVAGAKEKAPSWGLKNSGELFDLGVKRQARKVDPKTWTLGESSANFESGGRGAGAISSGFGDFGGKSYGTYQLSKGTLNQFLQETPYGKKLAGLEVGSLDFDRQWQQLAKNDPEFEKAQYDFIKRTHYDKATGGLKEAGIDLSGRGKAVQDAVWSTAVQFGAGEKDGKTGAVPLFQKALAGRNIADMSDEQIISAVQDYKLANNDRLFKRSSADVRAGTAKRAVLEKQRLIALSRAENPNQAPAETVANAKGPTIAAQAQKTADSAKGVTEKEAVEIAQIAEQTGLNKRARTDGGDWAKDFGANVPPSPSIPATPAAPIVSAAQVPSMPAPTVSVPAPAKAASVQTPLNSNSSPVVPAVRIEGEVGQDVKERGIAHIVTGGLA